MKVENKQMLDPTGIGIKKVLIVTLTVLALGQAVWAQQAGDSPLKIFILAGQSNMQGQGVVDMDHPDYYNGGLGNLEWVMENLDIGDHLFNDTDGDGIKDDNESWTVRDDVWIRHIRENGELMKGDLTIGFTGYGGTSHMGPELQFGHVIGDHLDNQVLLVKTAWGGKSLYVDFRPPSSGGTVGPYYTQMLEEVQEAIDNLETDFPEYTGGGYEIAGFVWMQGWNDMINSTAIAEYAANLINLAADIRSEYYLPNLPFVIGELGNDGPAAPGSNMQNFRDAQRSGAEQIDNAIFVETTDFARPAEESPNVTHGHHWYGNAESYFLIGNGLGEGMIDVLPPLVDLNRDGKVDVKDFSILAQYWFQDESLVDIAPPPYGDGIVDYKDLAILAEYWLTATTIPPLPAPASNPNPANDAFSVDLNADLSWTGAFAESHEVYFGTTSPGTFRGNQTATTFDPGTMIISTTYYWRIDEVNPWGKTKGQVWSFTTESGPPPP